MIRAVGPWLIPGRQVQRARGFTLVEVLVGLAIMGLTLLVVMQLFAGGLRSAGISEDYSRAVLLAKAKMEEVLLPEDLEEAVEEGTFPDTPYRWRTAITQVELELGEEELRRYEETALFRVEVEILWPGVSADKSIHLSTVKLVTGQGVPSLPEGG